MGHDTNISYCQIMIFNNIFDKMQQEWTPSDDPAISLTPMLFHIQANDYYTSLNWPAISKETFWNIYEALLTCFWQGPLNMMFEEEFKL